MSCRVEDGARFQFAAVCIEECGVEFFWEEGFVFMAFVLGLCLGSFYNVCVHRYLTGQSILWPGSHCPSCGHVLSWWENIPVLSYLFLRARCRSCRKVIHWRYPALELVSGLLALALAQKYGPGWGWVLLMILAGMYLVASFIDLEECILPDILTFPAVPLALLSPLVLPISWLDAVLGSVCGAGIFLLLQQFYSRFRKMEGLGMGDIKLMLSLGALTGLTFLPLMILLSALSGLLAAVPQLLGPGGNGLRTAIPFGPFLCFGTFSALLWGEKILAIFSL